MVADFTEHVFADELTSVSRSPNSWFSDWIVLQPFDLLVWLSSLHSLLLLAITLSFVLNYTKSALKETHFRSASFLILKLLAIFLRQCKCIRDRMTAPSKLRILLATRLANNHLHQVRIIYGTWIFASLVLSTLFSARFHAMLALPHFDGPIDTLKDLARIVHDVRYIVLTVDQSSCLSTFTQSYPENRLFYTIGQYLNRLALVTGI